MSSETIGVGADASSPTLLTDWRLDAVVAGLSVVLLVDLAFDFRVHAEGITFSEEGFFTIPHVTFYAAFLAIGAVLGAVTYQRRRGGRSWREAVPAGYEAGALGVLVFGFNGVLEFGWHSAFGFEQGVEGITSPTHLILATGAALFLLSPLRATWRRDDAKGGAALLPALVSLSLVVALVSLFTTYAHPVGYPVVHRADGDAVKIGLASFVFVALLFVAVGTLLARRFRLPSGSMTLVLTPSGLASATIHGQYAFALPVVVAGLVADALVRWRPPRPSNPRILRLFGAAVPMAFTASYFAVAAVKSSIAWSPHVWPGTIVLSGLAGLLLTYVVLPDAESPTRT